MTSPATSSKHWFATQPGWRRSAAPSALLLDRAEIDEQIAAEG